MKKHLLTIVLLSAMFSTSYAQVGINTDLPNSTLDVVKSTDNAKPDGIQAPRVTYDELVAKNNAYSSSQTGALVYVTVAPASDVTPTGKVINVTRVGYYYFDGSLWQTIYKEPWYNSATSAPATSNTQNIYQMGRIGIGTASPGRALHIIGSGDGGASDDLIIDSNNPTAGSAGQIALRRAKGTNAAPTIVNSGDNIGDILFAPYNGSGYPDRAGIRAVINGSVTTTSQPTDLILAAGSSGTTIIERMRITSAGNVGIGTASPSELLHVNGNTYIHNNLNVNDNATVEKRLFVNGLISASTSQYVAEFNLGANSYAYANLSEDRGIKFITNSTASGGFLSSLTTGTTATGNGNNADRYLKLNIRTNNGIDDTDFIIRSSGATDRRIGIGVGNPSAKLHIKRGDTANILRLEGIQTGTGSVLVVDSEGYVKRASSLTAFTSNNNTELLNKIDNLEENIDTLNQKIRFLEEKISQLIK